MAYGSRPLIQPAALGFETVKLDVPCLKGLEKAIDGSFVGGFELASYPLS